MRKYQPAILGAIFIAVLSSIPYVKGCCCLWVIVGGVLVAYLLQQNSPTPIGTSDAAIQGLIAGGLAALLTVAVGLALQGGANPQDLEQIRDMMGREDIPPAFKNFIEWMASGNNALIVSLLFSIPIWSIFSMAGSFIGLAIFRKKVPPQPQA